jgi:hypothetical protein
MGKRERAKLEREQAARMEARSAVFAELWKQASYVKLNDRLQALNRAVSFAITYPQLADETQARARFRRLHRKIQKIEGAALKAAGFTP